MFTSTKWRATLIAQARYTEVPTSGTAQFERWLCAQYAGRAFLSHAWDCPKCNPGRLPPESLTSRACPHGERLFGEFLTHSEAIGLGRSQSTRKSRVHKAQEKSEYTEQIDSGSGHLMALCRSKRVR